MCSDFFLSCWILLEEGYDLTCLDWPIKQTWAGHGVLAKEHACFYEGNWLLDFLMLSQASLFRHIYAGTDYIFFSPRGITLTKFVFPLDFFLNILVRGKRKPVLDLQDLLCLVPKFGSYSPKGRKAAMSCNEVGEWNKGWTPISY